MNLTLRKNDLQYVLYNLKRLGLTKRKKDKTYGNNNKTNYCKGLYSNQTC